MEKKNSAGITKPIQIVYTLKSANPTWIVKVRIGKIKLKNVTIPSVIPPWASQAIPIIPLVVDNDMASSRHVPYWPKCVFKKVCCRFSEAVRNGCCLMSNQTALIATDISAKVDNKAKMFITL